MRNMPGMNGCGFTPVPASIVKALSLVQSQVESVNKSMRNKHGGYDYASTDDIYAAVTRLMGKAGLVIIPLEASHEIKRIEKDGKTSNWLAVTYQFVFCAADGETWTHDGCRRSIYCQWLGPQTHQAAASYAQKQFLRDQFKLPTGEKDLDDTPQTEKVVEVAPKRKSSHAAKKESAAIREKRANGDSTDEQTIEERFNELKREIEGAISVEHLRHLHDIHFDVDTQQSWSEFPHRWAKLLDDDYELRLDDLRQVEMGL